MIILRYCAIFIVDNLLHLKAYESLLTFLIQRKYWRPGGTVFFVPYFSSFHIYFGSFEYFFEIRITTFGQLEVSVFVIFFTLSINWTFNVSNNTGYPKITCNVCKINVDFPTRISFRRNNIVIIKHTWEGYFILFYFLLLPLWTSFNHLILSQKNYIFLHSKSNYSSLNRTF